MQQPTKFVFRELVSPADLRASFALRYAVYRKTPGLCCFDSLDPVSRYDVDPFDRYSRHYGVLEQSHAQDRLLGCLRVSCLSASPHCGAMREALAGSETALARLDGERVGLLPALAYSVERTRLTLVVRDVLAHDEDVVEAGRLVMMPDVRKTGLAGALRLAQGVVAAVTAQFFLAMGVPNALVNCHPHHRQFYRPFGFCELDGLAPHAEAALDGLLLVSLRGRPEWLFPETRALCEKLAGELRTTGQAVLATSTHRDKRVLQEAA